MKKFLFLSAVVVAIISASCNKCSTCTYTYQLAGEDSTVSFAEACGNKEDIQHYEDAIRAEAARNSGVVTCTQNKQ